MFLPSTTLRRSIVLALVVCTLSPLAAHARGERRAARKAAKAAARSGYPTPASTPAPATTPNLAPAADPTYASYQASAPLPAAAEPGSADLVLVDAKLVAPATALAGPAFAVQFCNQGLAAAPRFVVAAVTTADGQYRDDAPKSAIEVPGLAAGQSKEVVLRLPRTASQYVILALDPNGSVNELDKVNNSAVIDASAR
jgi:hypothetical protein